MDNLGVPMNDAVLNAYAMEKGMGKTVDQMTLAEKTALALDKFMEDTAYAAGNYSKENDTMAGSLSTLKAAWENFLAGNLSFDKVLDSAYNAMTIALETLGLEAYQPFLDSAKETVDQVVDILSMEDGTVDEKGLTKGERLRQLFTDKFKTLFDDVAANAPTWIGNVFSAITTALGDVNTVLPSAMNMATTLFQSLRDGFAKMKDPLLDGTETIAGDTLAMFTTFKADMLTTGLEFIGAFAQGISDDLAKGDESSVKKALDEGISNVINALSFTASTVLPAAKGLVQALADSLADPKVGAKLSDFVSDLIGDIGKLLVDDEFWSSLGDAVLNIGGGLLSGIFSGLSNAADTIWKAITDPDGTDVPESVKALQKSFNDIMTNSKAAEDAYSSAMGDIEARADLAEKYLAVLQEYEKLENPDEEMTKAAQNATQALLNLYPELSDRIDTNTGMFTDNAEAIRGVISAMQDLAKQQAYQELTEELTTQQADLIKQRVAQQAELTKLQVEQAKAQQQYDLLNADALYYLKNGTKGENKKALNADLQNLDYVNALSTLMADRFSEFFDINPYDGTAAAKSNISGEMWETFWTTASARLIEGKEEADTAVSEMQTTMADTEASIAAIQTRITELTNAWTTTFGAAATEAGTVKTALDSIEGDYNANINIHVNDDGSIIDNAGGMPQTYNASGLGYVPYDNYISRLHRGEMVLTRQQADTYRQGSGSGRQYAVSASLNVGSMTLNNGMDAQRVAQALSKETTRQVRALGRRKG